MWKKAFEQGICQASIGRSVNCNGDKNTWFVGQRLLNVMVMIAQEQDRFDFTLYVGVGLGHYLGGFTAIVQPKSWDLT